ncbi:MAG: hypothetical protein FD167_3793 [bacterium]|nr:MAG: hypothetical protein FD167_3793 [bacterium]
MSVELRTVNTINTITSNLSDNLPDELSETGETELFVFDNSNIEQPIEKRFRKLVKVWQSERPPSSFLRDLVSHPAYQQIIGLGRPAIVLLLKELQENPDWWFYALGMITGARPHIPEESTGRLKDIAKIWLEWGRKHGYII